MTVQDKPYPVVDRVIEMFSDWLAHRRELKEMLTMDAANFRDIARELGVSTDDLEAVLRHGPHAADELPKMLRALGIDTAGLARTEPLVLRDMERTCAMCDQKRQCRRDLAANSAAEHYKHYCANAPTIDSLR